MKPHPTFLGQPPYFWANVRSISQAVGYTVRRVENSAIKVPTLSEISDALRRLDLSDSHLIQGSGEPTELGRTLVAYYEYRARTLQEFVEPRLMTAARAKAVFEKLRSTLNPRCPVPMNKQKGDKREPAFLTGIVNMLIESNAGGHACEYDPRRLTTVTRNRAPLRTLARRVDGAFPTTVNPIAVWEIKEYYYTTTFGSRVADGVYESLLDGMELQELAEHEGIKVLHYLMIDAHYTWWQCGKSYLCRIIDMLHMGFVDEVLFGFEVVERLPQIVQQWCEIAVAREVNNRRA